MGTYSIDSITRYINFCEIIKRRNAKYLFAIFNTDKRKWTRRSLMEFYGYSPKKFLFLKLIFIWLIWWISSNCGEFQLYFYKNLFDPDEKSKILSHQTLNKSTLETIINEIFSTDVDENEHIIKNFKEEYEL